MPTFNDRMSALRDTVHGAPGLARWSALCALLEAWPPQEDLGAALDYTTEHLAAWPDALRPPPPAWREAFLAGAPPPAWALVRACDVTLLAVDVDHRPCTFKLLRELGWPQHTAATIALRTPLTIAAAVGSHRAADLAAQLEEVGAEVIVTATAGPLPPAERATPDEAREIDLDAPVTLRGDDEAADPTAFGVDPARLALTPPPEDASAAQLQAYIDALDAALHEPDREIRRQAVLELRRLDRPEQIGPLLLRAAADEDPQVQAAAIAGLGPWAGPRALAWVRAALEGVNPDLNEAGAFAARAFTEPSLLSTLCAALTAPLLYDSTLGFIGEALAARGEATIPPLVDLLLHTDALVLVRTLSVLVQLNARGVAPAITRLLRHEHAGVTGAALDALARLDDPEALDGLIAALRERHPPFFILRALARRRDPRAFEALRDFLEVCPSICRDDALRAIAAIRHPASLALIARAAASTNRATRAEALRAIAALAPDDAEERLSAGVFDEDPAVVELAASLLAAWRRGRPLDVERRGI